MKIYSMTATFGKLDHETLTLQPGLNVIQAPNEWGKSTWCAFLVAMLYGLEPRARSTQATLSDKEHYAPWSGAPMSGSMDLCWNGRDITIQRKTKGRSIFGDFKAFETRSGLPVPELTAANCGQLLLGVEKSVFTRSAFIRLSDLPVTQDEALRHRLNALVTTGDDSGTAEHLEQKLRDLKNRCRYNRTGLLPQAEAEAAELERKLREMESLHGQAERLRQQQTELGQTLSALENHRDALAYAKAQEDAALVAQAQDLQKQNTRQVRDLEAACSGKPSKAQAEQAIKSLHTLQQKWAALQRDAQQLPPAPAAPETTGPFRGMSPEAALRMVDKDTNAYRSLTAGSAFFWLIPILLLAAIGTAVLIWLPEYAPAAWAAFAATFVLGVVFLFWYLRRREQAVALRTHYGSADPALWQSAVNDYVSSQNAYEQAVAAYQAARDAVAQKQAVLQAETDHLCNDQTPQACLARWQQVTENWEALDAARRELAQTELHLRALQAMATEAPPPAMPDMLTCTEAETSRRISQATVQIHQLHSRLGQCLGQMESIGQPAVLETRLGALRQRITRLEETYAALTLALESLQTARAVLQRRFAPKITQRAQQIMDRLTGGRYDRLLLAQDLSVQAAAQNEDTLRAALWRSDGTTDQLYLALRLAVAGELMPDAPLVLDDALVRFDDQRLGAAMEVLKEEATAKQVLLFTCHQRESQYL